MVKIQRVSKRFFFLLIFIAVIIAAISVPAFATITTRIDYPEAQSRISGQIRITGVADSTGQFNSYVLERQNPGGSTWLTISQSNTKPTEDGSPGILGVFNSAGFPSGEYKFRLTVYAEGTSQSVIREQIFIPSSTYVTNVSVNPTKFNPYNNETTTISYNLPYDGEVTLKIYDWASMNLIETQEVGLQAAGIHTFVWNGHDITGKAYPDKPYLFTIKVLRSSDGTVQIYNPAHGLNITVLQGGNQVNLLSNITISPAFKPELNDLCHITYDLAAPAWVRIAIGHQAGVYYYLHYSMPGNGWVPKLAGSHVDYWNGRMLSSNRDTYVISNSEFLAAIWAVTLADNVIITEGRTPEVTNLQANPVIIDLTSAQGTNLSYTLSRDTNVTITIYNNSNFDTPVRTLINNQPRLAGTRTEYWDGLSDSGFYCAPPYPYTFKIEAVDSDGNAAERKYGSIVVKGY